MNIIVTGYLKQNLPTESRKQFSGILITKNGGKQLFIISSKWGIILRYDVGKRKRKKFYK